MMSKQTNIAPTLQTRLKGLTKLFVALLLLMLGLHFCIAGNRWHQLAPGIEYYDLTTNHFTPWSHIHAFRVNLKENKLSLSTSKELHRDFASVDELAQFKKSLIAINGGFFDKNYHPLGLRVRNHQELNPFKSISWWGVFYTTKQQAHLSSAREFKFKDGIDFAVQSGPRLLIDGRIPSLRTDQAERSALGITKDGQIIILVTEHTPLSTTELARLMKAPPLNCLQALNLDGGSSSQLYAKIDAFRLNVHGFSNVSDAVIVTAKK